MSDSTHRLSLFPSKPDSPYDQVVNFYDLKIPHIFVNLLQSYSSSWEQRKRTQPPGRRAWCSPADGQRGELIQSHQLHCQNQKQGPSQGRAATPCWGSFPSIPRNSQSGFLKEHRSCILIHTFLSLPGKHTPCGTCPCRFLPRVPKQTQLPMVCASPGRQLGAKSNYTAEPAGWKCQHYLDSCWVSLLELSGQSHQQWAQHPTPS